MAHDNNKCSCEIQNLIINHKSQPVKLNPEPYLLYSLLTL